MDNLFFANFNIIQLNILDCFQLGGDGKAIWNLIYCIRHF